ncbi:hypothetical protein SLA2020_335930 [Shorea laevis]
MRKAREVCRPSGRYGLVSVGACAYTWYILGKMYMKMCVGAHEGSHRLRRVKTCVRAHGLSWCVSTGVRPAHDACRVKTCLKNRMGASVRACECLARRQHVRHALEHMTVDGGSKFLDLVDW